MTAEAGYRRRSGELAGLAGLTAVTALAWFALARRQPADGAMNMPMGDPSLSDHVSVWMVMTVAMMLPVATRMLARGGRGATGVLAAAAGYLGPWLAFALAVGSGETLLAGLPPTPGFLPAVVLAATAVYQISPWKSSALLECRRAAAEPIAPGPLAAVVHGGRYALASLGGCAPLMIAFAAAGRMGLGWTLGLTAWLVVETEVGAGRLAARLGGALLLVGAAGLAAGWITP